eukprot:CFRG5037T1
MMEKKGVGSQHLSTVKENAESIFEIQDMKEKVGAGSVGASFAQKLDIVPWPKGVYTGFSQNLIVGLISFCCPGLFNALQGLGGAGQDNAQVSAAMNAALYGFFTIFGCFGGFFFNILGNKILLFFGGLTYAFYSLSVFLYGNDSSYAGMAIASSAILGIGAGMFWTAQGAMTLSYSTENQKGTFTAIFWIFFNLGGVFGGILTFIMNRGNGDGTVSSATYHMFCYMMVFGAVLGLVLVVHPCKVIKADGSNITFEKAASPKLELISILQLFKNKYMLLLTPMILQSNWFYAYDFGINVTIFDAATRGLNSALFWGMQMLAAYLLGVLFLDSKAMGRRKRAMVGLIIVGSCNLAMWIYAAWHQFTYNYDKDSQPNPKISYEDGGKYWVSAALFMCMGFTDALVQTYAYWIIGAISNSTKVLAQYAGYYKGMQSLGACASWLLDLKLLYKWEMVICILWAVAFLPPTMVVAAMVEDNTSDSCEHTCDTSDITEGKHGIKDKSEYGN